VPGAYRGVASMTYDGPHDGLGRELARPAAVLVHQRPDQYPLPCVASHTERAAQWCVSIYYFLEICQQHINLRRYIQWDRLSPRQRVIGGRDQPARGRNS
jgi:hypothetical protein